MTNHWLDTSEYPFKANYFSVNGYNMHYIDEGSGETILFVHGTPSWSFDFRNIIKGLKDRYRCIAIDHIGFGLSDKPEHYDYSTQNHSKTLEKFITEKKLDRFTLVVHDFGGPIGLNFAIRYPGKVAGLIVLNSWLWSSKADPDFVRFEKVLKNPMLPFLYRYLNFSPRFVLPASFGEHKISKKLLKQYTKPFENRSERNGALAFAKSLLNDQDWFDELWADRKRISEKPTLFIWGMKDPVIKPNYLKTFENNFPNATTTQIETSGHFPQEEQPQQVINAMREFMTRTYSLPKA